MDTRKVLEMGGGTVLISLPKDWAKRNGIVRGSSVNVEEISAGRLMVKPIPEKGAKLEEREVLIEHTAENLGDVVNDITGAYLIGSNAIRVQGKTVISREDRGRLKSSVTRLVGLEIVDEDAKSMTLQFLPDPTVLDPEKIVRRMASLIGGMLRDAADGMRDDPRLLALVGERDDEVDRLYFLLVRTIRTATMNPDVAERYGLAPIECLDYRVLASYLENMGDAIADFSRKAAEEKELGREVAARFVGFLSSLESMGDVAVSSFLGRKHIQPKTTHSKVATMRETLSELSSGLVALKGMSTGTVVDLLGPLERLGSILFDISDLALPTTHFGPQ